MFTGIVENMGTVAAVAANAFGVRLTIDPGAVSYRPAAGDSIAVNGVCLTHAPDDGDASGQLVFDVIRETLDRTNLGRLKTGDRVNLEASLRAETPIAGHFVQGHVDAVGTVAAIQSGEDQWRITIEADATVLPYIVPKGSIAIDGVSLTIASVDAAARRFDVALIPTTLKLTKLGTAAAGDPVNLETDMIARTVVHYLRLQSGDTGTLTMQKLREAGW